MVKFDQKHMAGSNVSSVIESPAPFRRAKMPPSDLIEADESQVFLAYLHADYRYRNYYHCDYSQAKI